MFPNAALNSGQLGRLTDRTPGRCVSPAIALPKAWICLALLGLAGAAGCTNSYVASLDNAQGVQLFQQGRLQEALRQFQQATCEDPLNADGYYNVAAAYHRLGQLEHRGADYDEAEEYYNQCLDHDPNHRECYRGLAVLLAEERRIDAAYRLIENWGHRQPGLADPKIELARLDEEGGNRRAAQERLIDALTVEPNNPRALAALGRIREFEGEPAQALANYQRSLWHDRSQSGVAMRISALQGTPAYGNSWTAPDGSLQTASGPANPWR
jgi:tetratricopeptide (TPR) repeat protein